MKIKILQSCSLGLGYSSLLPDRIVEIPDAVAEAWIKLGRAEPAPDSVESKPKKETAIRRRRIETRDK